MNGKKFLSATLAATMIFSLSTLSAKAQWYDVSGEKKWMDNGSYVSGWKFIDGQYYFFNKSTNLVKGWFQDESNSWYFSDYETGIMQTGWVPANSTDWYYLNPLNGIMQSNTDIDIDGSKYFFNDIGIMLRGEQVINGYKYILAQSGEFISKGEKVEDEGAWVNEDGQYYFVKNGVKQTGWLTLNSKKYYLEKPTGKMLINKQVIDGKTYEFARNGELIGEIEAEDTDYAKNYDATLYRSSKSDLLDLMNEERDFEKIDDLGWIRSDGLDKAAFVRANELTEKLSDTRPNGKDWETVLDDLKLKNDNVEEYFVQAKTADEAFDSFLDEKYAYRAMIDEDFTDVAIGVAKDGSTYNWVIMFTDGETTTGTDGKYDSTANKTEKREILELLNDARYDADVDDLTLARNNGLDKAAYKRAVEIAEKESNKRPNGKDFTTALDDYDVDYADAYECFYSNETDIDTIVESWLDTRADKRAITDDAYDQVGVGIYEDGRKMYTVILLIESDEESAEFDYREYSTERRELADLINEYRDDYDIDELTYDRRGNLEEAAFYRAVEVSNDDDNSSLTSFLKKYDITGSSSTPFEFSYEDETDAEHVFDELFDDYYDEITDSIYKNVGIGIAKKNGDLYWSVIFTK